MSAFDDLRAEWDDKLLAEQQDEDECLEKMTADRDAWKARAEKAEGVLRSGLSYEELCGAFDALTQLYEAAVARAKAEEPTP